MLRDNLVGLIEPMLCGAGAYPLALRTNRKQSSDDRPACLENPRPAGAESTLTENVASPFHAEPGQGKAINLYRRLGDHSNVDSRYGNFWDMFSAFMVASDDARNDLEGILIAAMPTANGSHPKPF